MAGWVNLISLSYIFGLLNIVRCPFCKTSNYAVEYRGVRTVDEIGKEQIVRSASPLVLSIHGWMKVSKCCKNKTKGFLLLLMFLLCAGRTKGYRSENKDATAGASR